MIKITHPQASHGKVWTCSCGELITEAAACGTCYAVLCAVCAAAAGHTVPAGERAGKPCPSSQPAAAAA
jgi:hypothetical protein